jgi:hypothetical protein
MRYIEYYLKTSFGPIATLSKFNVFESMFR